MNTSVQNTDTRLERIEELKRQLAPIKMNLENLQENVERFLELSNSKLNNYIKEKCKGIIEDDTDIRVSINDRYTKIYVENKNSRGGWHHSFDLTVELHGFDRYSFSSNNPKEFNPDKIQYSISASSGSTSLENLQSVDRTILHAFLCTEMKTFGKDRSKDTFFSLLTNYLTTYFHYMNDSDDIKSEIYPINHEISSIKREIEVEEKAVADGLVLVEISKSIGVKLEFNEESITENDKYIYGRSLKQLFNLDWFATTITILKVSPKTVSIQVGSCTWETKRIKKADMIKAFPKLKVYVEENENA
jgi:hypothetical protein